MHQQQLKIYNARIITPHTIIENGSILISGKKITAITERNIEAEDATAIDAKGNYAAPGFIDIHVHGGGGHRFYGWKRNCLFEDSGIACAIWHHVNVANYLNKQ